MSSFISRCLFPSAQWGSSRKIVPMWNYSQPGLWIILSNWAIKLLLLLLLSYMYFLGSPKAGPSSLNILKRRQRSLRFYLKNSAIHTPTIIMSNSNVPLTRGGCNSSMWRCIAMHHVTIWHWLINADALLQDHNKKHVTGTFERALPRLFSEWDQNKQSSNVSFG